MNPTSLSCLIVDDEPMARALLEQYVARLSYLTLAGSLGNPLQALERLKSTPPDILFLDVQMPQLTGTSLLKVLGKQPTVVLTTAYSEYALEGYELDVTDYLLKPITFERFLKSVERIRTKHSPGEVFPPGLHRGPLPPLTRPTEVQPGFLFIKDGTSSVRVNLADIQYIEGMKDYVRIHTPQRKITTLQSLRNLTETLPADRFLRTHLSYIVGLDWIEEVNRDDIRIGQARVPISDSYRKEVKEYVEQRYLR